jgi:hypothetical protein
MKFKKGEMVLVSNFNGGYSPRVISSNNNNGTYELGEGYYTTTWREKDIHKCPVSIKKNLKQKESE